jgi:hypothetical protein
MFITDINGTQKARVIRGICTDKHLCSLLFTENGLKFGGIFIKVGKVINIFTVHVISLVRLPTLVTL